MTDRGRHIIHLFANWGESVSDKQIKAWEGASGEWTDQQFWSGVEGCIGDRDRKWKPTCFADFAVYLPPLAGDSRVITRCYGGGDFTGDWENATLDGLLIACIYTLAYGDSLPAHIRMLCHERGVTDDDLKEGKRACPDGAGCARWVELWRAGRLAS